VLFIKKFFFIKVQYLFSLIYANQEEIDYFWGKLSEGGKNKQKELPLLYLNN
jgi:hypothetical protein